MLTVISSKSVLVGSLGRENTIVVMVEKVTAVGRGRILHDLASGTDRKEKAKGWGVLAVTLPYERLSFTGGRPEGWGAAGVTASMGKDRNQGSASEPQKLLRRGQ